MAVYGEVLLLATRLQGHETGLEWRLRLNSEIAELILCFCLVCLLKIHRMSLLIFLLEP